MDQWPNWLHTPAQFEGAALIICSSDFNFNIVTIKLDVKWELIIWVTILSSVFINVLQFTNRINTMYQKLNVITKYTISCPLDRLSFMKIIWQRYMYVSTCMRQLFLSNVCQLEFGKTQTHIMLKHFTTLKCSVFCLRSAHYLHSSV
jgi:hypothetical protein